MNGDAMTRTLMLLVVALSVTRVATAETSLSVGEMTVNGQVMQNLSCKLSKGGFLATTVLVATIAKQKAALDRCGPAGEAFRVSFTWTGGKTTAVEVQAASREKGRQCVARAFQKMRPTLQGSCTAVVLTGNTNAAKAAAAKLQTKNGGAGNSGGSPSINWKRLSSSKQHWALEFPSEAEVYKVKVGSTVQWSGATAQTDDISIYAVAKLGVQQNAKVYDELEGQLLRLPAKAQWQKSAPVTGKQGFMRYQVAELEVKNQHVTRVRGSGPHGAYLMILITPSTGHDATRRHWVGSLSAN